MRNKLFGDRSCSSTCLISFLPWKFTVESPDDHWFDGKPVINQYLGSGSSPFTVESGQQGVTDLGDPRYLYMFDVLSNAMWGSLAAHVFDWPDAATVFGTTKFGENDRGDEIGVWAGLDAGRRFEDAWDITMGAVLSSVRRHNPEYLLTQPVPPDDPMVLSDRHSKLRSRSLF